MQSQDDEARLPEEEPTTGGGNISEGRASYNAHLVDAACQTVELRQQPIFSRPSYRPARDAFWRSTLNRPDISGKERHSSPPRQE